MTSTLKVLLLGFLEAVDKSGLHITPREQLQVFRLVMSRKQWEVESLRASLASLLATNQDEWERIGGCFDQHLRDVLTAQFALERLQEARPEPEREPLDRGQPDQGQPDQGQINSVKDPSVPTLPKSRLARFRQWLTLRQQYRQALKHSLEGLSLLFSGWGDVGQRLIAGLIQPLLETLKREERRRRLILLGTLLALSIAALLVDRYWPEPPPPVQQDSAVIGSPPSISTRVQSSLEAQGRDLPKAVPQPVETLSWDQWLLSGALGLLLGLFGAAAWLFPASFAQWIAAHRQQAQEKATTAFRELIRQDTEHLERGSPASRTGHNTGSSIELHYHIAHPHLPVADVYLRESARFLARLGDQGRSSDFDIPRTIRDTLEAGGQFRLAWEVRSAPRALLVLVDTEGVDHPWLGGFRRALEVWKREGVLLDLYYFDQTPAHLTDEGRKRLVKLESLLERHPGAPLLIFTRRLLGWYTHSRSRWLVELPAHRRCAWVDPTPRSAQARIRVDRQALERLRGLGYQRFPLTGEGMRAMARYLTGEAATGKVDYPALPTEDLTSNHAPNALHKALHQWAWAAAQVPDATWEQLQALRQALPAVNSVLSTPHHLQCLLDYLQQVADEAGAMLETSTRRLELAVSIRQEIKKDWEKSHPTREERLEVEAHIRTLLYAQLTESEPDPSEPWQHAWWSVKVAVHKGLLEGNIYDTASHLLSGPLREETRQLLLDAYEQNTLPPETQVQLERLLFEAGLPTNSDNEQIQPSPTLSAKIEALDQGHVLSLADLAKRKAWSRLPRPMLLAVPLTLLALFGLLQLEWPHALLMRPPHRLETVYIPEIRRLVVKEAAASAGLEETTQRPQLVVIYPGSFLMGSPESEEGRFPDETQHRVTLTKRYLMSATEVTQAQYQAVMGENPSSEKGEKLPVIDVSWFDAVKFANSLSQKEGLESCYEINNDDVRWPKKLTCTGYRLPTEAEWEYAARAGSQQRYAGTDSLDDICKFGNVADKRAKEADAGYEYVACDDGFVELSPVRTYQPNGWGLFDMTGNVWVWTWDWYAEYGKEVVVDPVGGDAGSARISRGSSWFDHPRRLRVANRGWALPSRRNAALSFRLARSYP